METRLESFPVPKTSLSEAIPDLDVALDLLKRKSDAEALCDESQERCLIPVQAKRVTLNMTTKVRVQLSKGTKHVVSDEENGMNGDIGIGQIGSGESEATEYGCRNGIRKPTLIETIEEDDCIQLER
jgi:hypothetical protein